MTVTKADGVMVFTVNSNPKSKWPLFCQLLGTLCCTPFCFVSKSMKQKLGSSHTVLGALQIMVGVSNMAFGSLVRNASYWYTMLWDGCFWMGAVFIAAGIMCILVDKFPSQCLMCFSILVNLVSFGLGITAIVFYSLEIDVSRRYTCEYNNRYSYYYDRTTPVPTTMNPREDMKNCERYKALLTMLYGGMNIMMIVLCVLLLCLTISSCVLSLKALCKKTKENEVEDPELQKPLVED